MAGRAAGLLAVLGACAVLAGCGATDEAKVAGAQVYGSYLSVYSSLPLSGPDSRAGNEILNGERLAFAERKGKIGDFILNFVSLNALSGDGTETGNGQVALNARRAVTDPRSIAYIGDYERSQTRLSRVIIDQAQLLQVAPSEGRKGLPGGRESVPGFRAAYRKAFGSEPTDDALYGYQAMSDVLDAIERAGGEGGNRIAVADAFRAGPGN
jgi:ABC-type branched-subunit amino acid transport system substrate-binding protein